MNNTHRKEFTLCVTPIRNATSLKLTLSRFSQSSRIIISSLLLKEEDYHRKYFTSFSALKRRQLSFCLCYQFSSCSYCILSFCANRKSKKSLLHALIVCHRCVDEAGAHAKMEGMPAHCPHLHKNLLYSLMIHMKFWSTAFFRYESKKKSPP